MSMVTWIFMTVSMFVFIFMLMLMLMAIGNLWKAIHLSVLVIWKALRWLASPRPAGAERAIIQGALRFIGYSYNFSPVFLAFNGWIKHLLARNSIAPWGVLALRCVLALWGLLALYDVFSLCDTFVLCDALVLGVFIGPRWLDVLACLIEAYLIEAWLIETCLIEACLIDVWLIDTSDFQYK
jgi:hypothetical protein